MSKTKELTQEELVDIMAGCPTQWFGDHGFQLWCQELYQKGFDAGVASVPPVSRTEEHHKKEPEHKHK